VVTEMAEDVEDPLKALSEVYEPDSRQAHFVGHFADNYAVLSRMALHVQVPKNVRQLFETAKNCVAIFMVCVPISSSS